MDDKKQLDLLRFHYDQSQRICNPREYEARQDKLFNQVVQFLLWHFDPDERNEIEKEEEE